ncbi:MAG: hypothetical protein ACD_51C00075G0001 [uncultured bacterium]|nr:MAG: hypothetical protein ACD_51C00075G0001 [uncultured bacterium]OGJ48552.1 MAG: hypothetical protein A2244_02570 [Candidatus Peregrinibacteria bacterium RIFOXYA2_FULL_41_18]OGJ48884.1 MAG: hypothetical protein A2344_02970 [Candidatus Peregrinibacteria bacterium RIFOXYB12_FULL_41_12]OGJ52579.1 MAG: hypothetical protein A2448_05030 [Candidatus Peregrinibacteria bacterium RIFOXYC2_FULL_41_22]OGJ53669.1 MAG: hypothetical protein A2336_01865 [Candidatus Peregrinibacteria bacterium RIFOXYB2_FULL
MTNQGENMARDFLLSKGYEILAMNFRAGQMGEVDIVCRDGDEVVFVEVKMRSGNDFGEPEEAVGLRKLAKIRRVAEIYLSQNRLEKSLWRIDVIAIKNNEIEHITID